MRVKKNFKLLKRAQARALAPYPPDPVSVLAHRTSTAYHPLSLTPDRALLHSGYV